MTDSMLDYAAESKIVRHTERKTSPSPDHVSFLVVVCRVTERVSPGAMWQHLPCNKNLVKVTCVPVGKLCYFRRFPPVLYYLVLFSSSSSARSTDCFSIVCRRDSQWLSTPSHCAVLLCLCVCIEVCMSHRNSPDPTVSSQAMNSNINI
jgi:hypothetical protein